MSQHTIEKIGGTSMSDWQACRDNIFLLDRENLYNRGFVVSAYGGVTNKLLEHKKTDEPGVYALFTNNDSDWAWGDAMTQMSQHLCQINKGLFPDPLVLEQADRFIQERVEGVRNALVDLQRLCSYGHFHLDNHLLTVREMLAGIGEAHSAYNTALLLRNEGVNARFVDLTGWREQITHNMDEKILLSFKHIDFSKELPIITGYTNCSEGLMRTYDRGYSEITFSKIAELTAAREAIIHKEYHLSSADPNVVGVDKVVPIGRTNYDVADQLSMLGMEAIHPKAARGLRIKEIPLRVKNTFEPEHTGTLFTGDYISSEPRVEIIAGTHTFAIEVFDQEMVSTAGYEEAFLKYIRRFNGKPCGKDMNANSIVQYVDTNLKNARRIEQVLKDHYPTAQVSVRKVSMVSAIGSDLAVPGLLAKAVAALSEAGLNILAVHQVPRQVDIRFVVGESEYEKAVSALHGALIEPHNHDYAICAASI